MLFAQLRVTADKYMSGDYWYMRALRYMSAIDEGDRCDRWRGIDYLLVLMPSHVDAVIGIRTTGTTLSDAITLR